MKAPDPGDLGAQIAATLDRIAPGVSGRSLAQDAPLGVAVSGGSDSTALLIAARDWAASRGRVLQVATVDHGLRVESAAEAVAVAGLSAGLGLSHTILRAPPLAPGNLSARAREARLGLLAAWARESGLAAVMLGHTLDDQAETVLMRLGRGSGADGLSGMTETADRLEVLWLRPLLNLRRAVLRDWLSRRGIGWIDDPTNDDPAHQRVRLRRALDVLADAGVPPEMIAASALRLAAQRRVLDAVTGDLAARARSIGSAGEILIDRMALVAADPEIAGRLMAASIRAITGADYAPRGVPLGALVAGLAAEPPRGASLGGVLVRAARGGCVLLCREPSAVAAAVEIDARGAIWDARWQVGPADAAGLTLGALGAEGARTLAPRLRPRGWEAMAHVVRLTLPAIRRGAEVLGIPLPHGAEDCAERQPGLPVARNLVRERLPCPPDRR